MAPDAAALQAAWDRDRASIAAHGHGAPITLGERDFAALARGDAIARRVDSGDGAFATGAAWVPGPIAAAWIALQDAGDRPLSSGAVHEWLPGATPTSRQTYMRIDLPWPVSDRQWVAEFRANGDLYATTDHRVWERSWAIADPALAPHPDPDAMWIREATGAWTLLDVGDGCLAIFAVRTVLGGSIPTEITQAWAVTTVKNTVRKLVERAPTVAEHYGSAHTPMYTPDGALLPPHLVP
jgi:hypothetical protein